MNCTWFEPLITRMLVTRRAASIATVILPLWEGIHAAGARFCRSCTLDWAGSLENSSGLMLLLLLLYQVDERGRVLHPTNGFLSTILIFSSRGNLFLPKMLSTCLVDPNQWRRFWIFFVDLRQVAASGSLFCLPVTGPEPVGLGLMNILMNFVINSNTRFVVAQWRRHWRHLWRRVVSFILREKISFRRTGNFALHLVHVALFNYWCRVECSFLKIVWGESLPLTRLFHVCNERIKSWNSLDIV